MGAAGEPAHTTHAARAQGSGMARIRVLHVLHQPIDGRSIGGTELHVRDLATHLAPAEFETWVAYTDANCLFAERWDAGARVDSLAFVHGLSLGESSVRDQRLTPYIRTLLATVRADVVHIHHWINVTFEPLAVARLLSLPAVHTVHDDRLLRLSDDELRSLEPLLRTATLTVFPSQSLRGRLLERIDFGATEVIQHGVAPLTAARLSNPDERFCVLFLGASHLPEKGRSVVEAVVPRLVASGTDVVLLGAPADFLDDLQGRDEFTNLGPYIREELPHLLAAARPTIVVLVSMAAESFSFTLSEAWRSGVPVIATEIGALTERVAGTGAGMLVPPGDADAVIRAIRELQEQPGRLSALWQSARAVRVPLLADQIRQLGDLYAALSADAPPASYGEHRADARVARATAAELERLHRASAAQIVELHDQVRAHRATQGRLAYAEDELRKLRGALDGSRAIRLVRRVNRLLGRSLPADSPMAPTSESDGSNRR